MRWRRCGKRLRFVEVGGMQGLAESLAQALGFWPMYPLRKRGGKLRTSVTFRKPNLLRKVVARPKL